MIIPIPGCSEDEFTDNDELYSSALENSTLEFNELTDTTRRLNIKAELTNDREEGKDIIKEGQGSPARSQLPGCKQFLPREVKRESGSIREETAYRNIFDSSVVTKNEAIDSE